MPITISHAAASIRGWFQDTIKFVLGQILNASTPTPGDRFGIDQDISGDGSTLAVVAIGSVTVFTKSGSVWSQQQVISNANIISGLNAEPNIEITSDGNMFIVGCPGETIGGNTQQGSAYVYVRSAGVWSLQQKLTASDGASGDEFGANVAINDVGDTVVIGAPTDDISGYFERGSAYVFTRSGSVWTEQQKLTASDGLTNDWFGWSTAISGDGSTIIIGAYQDDFGVQFNRGSAYVFTNTGTWTQQQKLIGSSTGQVDFFGYSIAVNTDGTVAVIGAPGDFTLNQGSAFIFTKTGGVWSEEQEIETVYPYPGITYDDWFGKQVSINGNGTQVAITSIGGVCVFTKYQGQWSQEQKIIPNDVVGVFGPDSVSQSSLGNIITIGDTRNVNIENGIVYIYTND